MKKVAVLFGRGFEEIEAVAVVDILRRAELHVDLVNVADEEWATGSHAITIRTEQKLSQLEINDYAALVLPGGPGVTALLANSAVVELVQTAAAHHLVVAAICAAPQLLGKAGLTDGVKLTHYPGCNQFLDTAQVDLAQPSLVDGQIITGRSPGTAMAFALQIVDQLMGAEICEKVATSLVIKPL